jgi:hypothetical protein
MPRGDDTKRAAFKLWLDGKPLKVIQAQIEAESDTKPGSVRGWVLDWERGAQRTWTARLAEE